MMDWSKLFIGVVREPLSCLSLISEGFNFLMAGMLEQVVLDVCAISGFLGSDRLGLV